MSSSKQSMSIKGNGQEDKLEPFHNIRMHLVDINMHVNCRIQTICMVWVDDNGIGFSSN